MKCRVVKRTSPTDYFPKWEFFAMVEVPDGCRAIMVEGQLYTWCDSFERGEFRPSELHYVDTPLSTPQYKAIPQLVYKSLDLTPARDLKCQCENQCGSHPEAPECPDFARVACSFAGDVLKAVCVDCAVELLKKVLIS